MAKRLSEDERARWVARWRASGMSCARFAKEHGLAESTLYRWGQQCKAVAAVRPGFAEVRVVGAATRASLEVEHPSGCVVRVHGAVEEGQLAAVLRALGTC